MVRIPSGMGTYECIASGAYRKKSSVHGGGDGGGEKTNGGAGGGGGTLGGTSAGGGDLQMRFRYAARAEHPDGQDISSTHEPHGRVEEYRMHSVGRMKEYMTHHG